MAVIPFGATSLDAARRPRPMGGQAVGQAARRSGSRLWPRRPLAPTRRPAARPSLAIVSVTPFHPSSSWLSLQAVAEMNAVFAREVDPRRASRDALGWRSLCLPEE